MESLLPKTQISLVKSVCNLAQSRKYHCRALQFFLCDLTAEMDVMDEIWFLEHFLGYILYCPPIFILYVRVTLYMFMADMYCIWIAALLFFVCLLITWCTHWGRVTHICVSKLTTIGSGNGLLPGRCLALMWTNAGILLVGPMGTNFSEILMEIYEFSFKKMHLKMSSGKWQLFCHGLNLLIMKLYYLIYMYVWYVLNWWHYDLLWYQMHMTRIWLQLFILVLNELLNTGACCGNWGHPSEIHLTIKTHEISSAHNVYFSRQIVLQFYTDHGNITVVLCANILNYGRTRFCQFWI